MNPFVMISAVVVLALSGCAAAPVSDSTALQINDGETQNYWIPTSKVVATPLDMSDTRTRSGASRPMAHSVEVSYVIGSNGKVRDARVVSTEPANASGQWALAGLSAAAYEPGPDNAARVPIRLTHTMTLGAPPVSE